MKKFVCIMLLGLILITGIVSCTTGTGTDTPVPTTTTGEIKESVPTGSTALALDLYRQLKDGDSNLFYSPFSIYTALAMTSAGAKENTLWQMASALHFSTTGEPLHQLLSELNAALKSRSQDVKVRVQGDTEETIDGFTLNIVNALWGQQDYHFLEEYINLIEKYYDGGLNEVDFIKETEKARLAINEWASEQTNGRIKDLIGPTDIDNLTRLVLTNAIYFNAHWQIEFDEKDTIPAPFYLQDDKTVTVPMMHQTFNTGYAEVSGCQALSLPYLGGELDMVVLLPEEGKFNEFENSMDAQVVKEILAQMKFQEVKITLPKFQFESEFKLKPVLQALGMTDAFDDTRADFSGITGEKDLFISEVIHKSFIAVDENGTEAAAVTAVIMNLVSMPEKIYEFNADHPFIFFIRDIQTGTILFMGRVVNPAAK
jgi:serpin B